MSKFLSRFKGEKEDRSDLTPSQTPLSSNNPYRYTQSQPPAYEPSNEQPPKNSYVQQDTTSNDNPPPYHDWTSVPDTALLPPPPAIASEYSTTSNATYDEAAAAHAWCARNHVYTPQIPNVHLIETVQAGQHHLDQPSTFRGTISRLNQNTSPSSFTTNAYNAMPTTIIRLSSHNPNPTSHALPDSQKSSFSRRLKSSSSKSAAQTSLPPGDQTHLTVLPLYFAATSNPNSPHFASAKATSKLVYFELTPLAFHSPESTVSIGYAAKPYPPNRQPGWHRASVAVHSDDGNRYINDSWGGREFTKPIHAGETVGLAIEFTTEHLVGDKEKKKVLQSETEIRSSLPKCRTRVYFTRNGNVEGSWEVDEERDAEHDEGVAGLMGEVDLYAAVGTFGSVEAEVRFFAEGEGFVAPPPIPF